jgi:hypothetical protein
MWRGQGIAITLLGWIWLDFYLLERAADSWRGRRLFPLSVADAFVVSRKTTIFQKHSYRSVLRSNDISISEAAGSRTWTLPKRGRSDGISAGGDVQERGRRTPNGNNSSSMSPTKRPTTATTKRPSTSNGSFGRKFKQRPMPVTGYDAKAILEYYDMRPLAVGWRLNILGFPLLGEKRKSLHRPLLLCNK